MKEEKVKGKNNTILIVIIVILLIVIIIDGGYIFLNKDNYKTKSVVVSNSTNAESENEQKDVEKNTDIQEEENKADIADIQEVKTNTIIAFDGSKSINSSEKNYTLSCQGNAGIWITVDSTQKTLTFSFTPTRVIEFYTLNWTSTKNDMVNSKINFDKKIVNVFFGSMGQSSSGDTLFILLEDGTVEYIPIVYMFNHVQAEVVSYGKIDGVSDVVKFTLSNTSEGVTTLAIKNDGTFYDLWYALKDNGNY